MRYHYPCVCHCRLVGGHVGGSDDMTAMTLSLGFGEVINSLKTLPYHDSRIDLIAGDTADYDVCHLIIPFHKVDSGQMSQAARQ